VLAHKEFNMSRRAISFVEDWVRENINAQPYLDEEGRDTRPRA
jgi:hypothetical protein